MKKPNESQQVRWTFLIDRLKELIAKKGKKIVIINVQAMSDPQEQFKRYQLMCETVKNQFEVVVATSLPGEERIFQPYQDVQFYIRDSDEKIHSTGNSQVIQDVFKVNKEPINTDVLAMEFWRQESLILHLDNYKYIGEIPHIVFILIYGSFILKNIQIPV